MTGLLQHHNVLGHPVWKGISAGLAERGDESSYHLPPLIEDFNHPLQCFMVVAVPLGWNRIGTAPEVDDVACFGPCQSRLKRFPTGNVRIDAIPGIDAA